VVNNLLKSVDMWLNGEKDTELSYSSLRDALDNTAEVRGQHASQSDKPEAEPLTILLMSQKSSDFIGDS
jgi:hypothetical protein